MVMEAGAFIVSRPPRRSLLRVTTERSYPSHSFFRSPTTDRRTQTHRWSRLCATHRSDGCRRTRTASSGPCISAAGGVAIAHFALADPSVEECGPAMCAGLWRDPRGAAPVQPRVGACGEPYLTGVT